MSAINTNSIDINYPVPGQNNNTQGFRNNFASIKNNVDIAGAEINDLQTKAVLKSALTNSIINNDMGNALISNCSTRSFRATTYNLGNALSGTVFVDASLGDVHYGTVTGNVSFNFGKWAPFGTQSKIDLKLNVSNPNAIISFPSSIVNTDNDHGLTTLENYGGYAGNGNVTVPYGVTKLNYTLTSTDCGDTISIDPSNRPRQAAQIQQRTPPPTGYKGDVVGTVCVDPGVEQLTITSFSGSNIITSGSTSKLYVDMPVKFIGTMPASGITVNTVYYIKTISNSTTFTIASTVGGSPISPGTYNSPLYLVPVQYMYIAYDNFGATVYSRTATNTSGDYITLNNATSINVGDPIVFSEPVFGGLVAGRIFYISTIVGNQINVTRHRENGSIVGGTPVAFSTASGSCSATVYTGKNIFKRVELNSW